MRGEFMDVTKAIHSRRSVGKVKDKIPDKEIINTILEAGRWAPNHFRTQPWRYIVLAGDGRQTLADAYTEVDLHEQEYSDEEKVGIREKSRRKAFRAPVIIVLIVEPKNLPQVEFIEEIEACACATQNMLLTIHDLGLGAIWRTGKSCYHKLMKEKFQVSNQGMVTGFLYVGYPDVEPKQPPKKQLDDFVTWITE
jgi:nitroreductase